MSAPPSPAYGDGEARVAEGNHGPVVLLSPSRPGSPSLRNHVPASARHTGASVDPISTGAPRTPRRSRVPRGPGGLDPRPGHIPGLDGLRALAIIGVLVYHFTPALLPGGFLGVDVFFVVSGFLITTLLLREIAQQGRIDLPRFWLRRARRLLPALVTVVVLSVAAARIIGGDLLVAIGRQAGGALTFSTNWVEIGAGASYFDSTSPLLFVNFWSLAVEEQFYLLWPFGLVLVLALTVTTTHRLYAVGGLALASALAMAVLHDPGVDATRVYYGTDTHAFGLMAGAALALAWAGPDRAWLRTARWRRWRGLGVGAALVVLALLMATLTEANPWTFRGGILLASLATVVLIAGLLETSSPWRLWMGLPPLRWLGSRSYGIYLWHWPVLVITGTLVPFAPGTATGRWVLATALILTLLVTEVSYRFVEVPIRRHGFVAPLRRAGSWLATPWRQSRRPRLVAGGLATVLLLMVVAIVTAPEKSQTQQQIEAAEAALATQPGDDGAAAATGTGQGLLLGGQGFPGGQDVPADADVAPPDQRAAAGARPGPAERWGWSQDDDGLWVPEGGDLTAIGDSLVVTSADGLTHRFPEIAYAARSNRQWKDALPVLEQALADGMVRDNVVVHFGTNAGVDEQTARAMMDALGPDRRIVLMNLYGTSTFVPGSNEIVEEIAADYPNVAVGDWNAAVTAAPEILQSDRVHPDLDGMHVYAEVVARGFDSLAGRG